MGGAPVPPPAPPPPLRARGPALPPPPRGRCPPPGRAGLPRRAGRERPAAERARPRVTGIGDSVITAVASPSQARGLLGRDVDLRWLAVVCRRLVQSSCWYNGTRPPTALDVIQTNGSSLGQTVIVESGYNEYVQQYASDIDTVMKALVAAGVQNVLWMTLREQRSDYATMNAQIRAAAARWPQMAVVDWNGASKNRDWFWDDGIHVNYPGAM